MNKNYRRLALYEWESLPAGSGIPPERFSSLRLVRREGVPTLLLALRGENSNPFEMYDEGAVEISIPCPSPAEVRDFIARVRAENRARRATQREEGARGFFRTMWEEEALEAAWRSGPSEEALEWASVYGYSHEAQSWGCSVASESLFGKEGKDYRTFGLEGERYLLLPKYLDGGTPRLIVAEAAGVSPYRESTREWSLTWTEAKEMFLSEMARRDAAKAEEEAAKAAQEADNKYLELWQQFQGMRVGRGFVIAIADGVPHVANGDKKFPIPKDIASFRGLCDKMPELLDNYYNAA